MWRAISMRKWKNLCMPLQAKLMVVTANLGLGNKGIGNGH